MGVNIMDVASRAQVSPITASRALSNPGLVKAVTREKVLRAASELGYVPNRLARGLRNGRSQTVAILTADSRQRLSLLKLEALQREITRRGYHLLLLGQQELAGEAAQERLASCRGTVEGLVIAYLAEGPALAEVRRMVAAGMPVVSLEYLAGLDADVVTADRELGARLATEHLLKLGRVPIALAASPEGSDVGARRAAGYRQAMAAAGQEPLIVSLPNTGDSLFANGYELIAAAGARGALPAAWICSDDEVAVGAIRALRDRGVRVPEDVAVVGWDNSPLCDYVDPRLTSVTQPVEEAVGRAVERLYARIQGETGPAKVAWISPRLVVRESCGALINRS